MPASAASPITSSRIGTSMSSPSIEKRVLPGNVRCRNRSNASTCVSRSSSATGSIGSAGARKRPASAAWRSHSPLFGHEDVREVVAGGRAVDPAEGRDDAPACSTRRRRAATRSGRRQRSQVVVGDAVASRAGATGSPSGVRAQRIELRGQVAVAADRLREVDRADASRAGTPDERRRRLVLVGRRRPALEQRARFRVDRRRVLPEALVQLEHVPAVDAGKPLPRPPYPYNPTPCRASSERCVGSPCGRSRVRRMHDAGQGVAPRAPTSCADPARRPAVAAPRTIFFDDFNGTRSIARSGTSSSPARPSTTSSRPTSIPRTCSRWAAAR